VSAKPKLLDLFCCGGGAARGYQMAGFHVTGVDIVPQPKYIGDDFHQGDALEFVALHGHEFDAIHASPPCQAFCSLKHMPNQCVHENLIPQTRAALIATGKPYVIENVPGAPLIDAITLCGTMFGLRTECGAELRRHRRFETNWFLMCGLTCQHGNGNRTVSIAGEKARDKKAE
jgi:DNA (cytosine-5)-methyltransferase 1